MATQNIQAVFWLPALRDLSSPDLGTSCYSETEAFDALYTRIASEQNPIQYINNIYDNAEVELQTDNMYRIVVKDHYDTCLVYAPASEKAHEDRQTLVRSLTIYPTDQAMPTAGMLYAKKCDSGPEPAFEERLNQIKTAAGA